MAGQNGGEFGKVQRPAQVFVRARFQGMKTIGTVTVAGGDNDAGIGRVLEFAQFAAELAALVARLEEITQNQLRRMFEGKRQARRPIRDFVNGPVPFLQPGRHSAAKVVIIVYDQAGIHDSTTGDHFGF
jgi:hypothetical protein